MYILVLYYGFVTMKKHRLTMPFRFAYAAICSAAFLVLGSQYWESGQVRCLYLKGYLRKNEQTIVLCICVCNATYTKQFDWCASTPCK